MRKLSLILSIILLAGIIKLDAQENTKKSLFVISPGYAVFNNGKQNGVSFSNEYIGNINRHITFGARFLFAYGEGKTKTSGLQQESHLSTTALVINCFYKPFKSVKHILLLGLGIYNDYTIKSYSPTTNYIVINDKTYSTTQTDRTISSGGPVFDLRYYYNFRKNVYLGVNLNARDIEFCQYFIGIGGGVKF